MRNRHGRLAIIVVLAQLAAGTACAPDDADVPPDRPPGAVPSAETSDGGAPVDTTSAVGITTLLERADQVRADGELAILSELGPPADTSFEPMRNRHDPAQTDTIVTYAYDGLELEVYRVSASGREMLQALRVSGAGYRTRDGLTIGSSRAEVRRVLGEPARTEDDAWVYEVLETPEDPTPTTLRVTFSGETVEALVWHFYVD